MQESKEPEPKINQLLDDLFRKESGKMISVMTRIFGSENLDLAEDVVQDAMMETMKNWEEQGIPDNPAGWLYRVAKNKALNIVNRNKYQRQYTSDVLHYLKSRWTVEPAADMLFSEEEIRAITLFNEYEAYSNWRRMGYPVLVPVDYPGNESNSQIPRRLRYPSGEASVNKANYDEAFSRLSNGDQFTSRMWWDAQ